MNQNKEQRPATVASAPKQAGEAREQRWSWVEPTVWTACMLEALERGVKGGKWFALIDKVYEEKALRRAFAAVQEKQGAAGSDGQSVQRFAARLADLQAQR